MSVPVVRERVRVEGRSGTFLVVWVDTHRQTADLIPAAEGRVIGSVPFSRIRPLVNDHEDGCGI